MKINPSEIPSLRNLSLETKIGLEFGSPMPSESLIRLAWGNPDLANQVSEERIGERLVETAARANRWVLGIEGVRTGIPSTVLPAFDLAVGEWGPDKWAEYAADTAISTMDLGIDAMGALPVIGAAAQVAVALVKTIVQLSKSDKPRPVLLLRYDKEVDEGKATDILQKKFGRALKPVFMPPTRDTRWHIDKATPGYSVAYSGVPTAGEQQGEGVIPGGFAIAGQLTSAVHWTSESAPFNVPSQHEGHKGKITSSGRRWVRNNPSLFADTIESSLNGWPAMQRAGLAAWSSLTATKSAGCFDIDTRGIVDAWNEWSHDADTGARDAMNGGEGNMTVDRYVGYRALQDSARLDFFGRSMIGNPTLGEVASYYIDDIRRLQLQQLDTLMVAYASRDQSAFDDPDLRDRLRERRDQLLTHSARWGVSLSDIPDESYREKMREATRGDRPLVALAAAGFDEEPTRANPLPDLSTSGLGGGAVVAAMAGLALAFA